MSISQRSVGRPALWQQSDLPVIIPVADLPPGKVVPQKISRTFCPRVTGIRSMFSSGKIRIFRGIYKVNFFHNGLWSSRMYVLKGKHEKIKMFFD